jgi:hypothetical protein
MIMRIIKIAALLLLLPAFVRGQEDTLRVAAPKQAPPCSPIFTYAAKFVCGIVQPGANDVAASGRYFSNINVHNPQRVDTVRFFKKFAVALRSERPGSVSDYVRTDLPADKTLLIDCENIAKHLNLNPNTFVEGFVIIESPRELDVVTVYTAGAGTNWPVSSIHTERVPTRLAEPCATQTRFLTAGTAPWTVVVEQSALVTPRPADIVTTHPWLQPAPFVSWNATASSGILPSTYEYEICFCLCSPDAQLQLTKFTADNIGTILLNGVPIGPQINSSSTLHWADAIELQGINAAAVGQFRPGKNCLRVRVDDDSGSYTGFFLDGIVSGTIVPCP